MKWHGQNNNRPVVAVYALDIDFARTSSLGIANYIVRLIEAFAKRPDPGFQVVFLVNKENVRKVIPSNMPEWMSECVVPWSCSGGLRRIWNDHVLSWYYAKKVEADIIHFPRGYKSLLMSSRLRVVATLHDAIVFHYARHYPKWGSWLKIKYFCGMTLHTLNRAARVMTISDFSRSELLRLNPAAAGKIEVIYPGAGIERSFTRVKGGRHGIMVVGSMFPHKAVCQSLKLLDEYAACKGGAALDVVVTGLREWPSEWGGRLEHLRLDFKGRVSDEALFRLYSQASVLVLLSEIEGCGLPAIESYLAGTPVCYRATTSLREVLQDELGGWDGNSFESFSTAFEEVMHMTEAEIGRIQKKILSRFDWGHAASRVLQIYAEELRKSGSRDA